MPVEWESDRLKPSSLEGVTQMSEAQLMRVRVIEFVEGCGIKQHQIRMVIKAAALPSQPLPRSCRFFK
jgi:hypothetical protein